MLIAASVGALGCAPSWKSVAVPGSGYAPRVGDRVEIVRSDGAVRTGRLTAMDADSLYADQFTAAWQDVADVRPLPDGEQAPVIGRFTRVGLRDGGIAEGYLAGIRADDLVLVTAHRDDEFVQADTLVVSRATIDSLEQRKDANGFAVLGGFVLGLAGVVALLLILFPPNWGYN
jgi:hypothetical protein